MTKLKAGTPVYRARHVHSSQLSDSPVPSTGSHSSQRNGTFASFVPASWQPPQYVLWFCPRSSERDQPHGLPPGKQLRIDIH